MEALRVEHADYGCWSVGDAWPEPLSLEESLARRRRRRQPEPPLLALRLGPLCVPLVSPRPPPPETEPLAIQQLSPSAGPADEAAPCPEVARLRCLVASREPGLEQRLAAAGEAANAAFYARWLKARGGCPEAAAAGILAHVAWREELVRGAQADAAAAESGGPAADAAGSHSCRAASCRGVGIPEAAIQDELAARKVFLQGCDTQGCPVIVVKAARHDMGQRDLRQTKRLIAYVLDSACAAADTRRNPAGRICCLFDLAGLRPRNLDVKALLAIFEMLQQHYVERLSCLYFLNAPLLFWGVWRVVSPFVHAATRAKIRFAGGGGVRRELADRVPPQVLPEEYGGEAQLVPIDAAAAAWRASRQQAAAAAAATPGDGAADAGPGSRRSGCGGRGAAVLRGAGSALGTARRVTTTAIVRPVGGALRALRHHQRQLAARLAGDRERALATAPASAQRSLLAVVVLQHVLLVSLLLRMLRRVLLRRPDSQRDDGRIGSPPPPADDPAEDDPPAATEAPVCPPAAATEAAEPST